MVYAIGLLPGGALRRLTTEVGKRMLATPILYSPYGGGLRLSDEQRRIEGQQSSGFSDLGTFDVAMDRKARSSGYATIQ